jgi:hypothetical protein
MGGVTVGLYTRKLTHEDPTDQVREVIAFEYAPGDSDTKRAQLTADGGSGGLIMLFEAIDDVMVRLRTLEAKATTTSGSGDVSRIEFESLTDQVMKLKKAVKRIHK